MGIPQKSLVIGACEIACHYPELSLNDAAGDALQLAEKIRLYGIEENQKKETVFIAACRFVSADKDLSLIHILSPISAMLRKHRKILLKHRSSP